MQSGVEGLTIITQNIKINRGDKINIVTRSIQLEWPKLTINIFQMLLMLIFYKTSVVIFHDLGLDQLATGTTFGWLFFIIYTWVGPSLFHRSLKKGLESFHLKEDDWEVKNENIWFKAYLFQSILDNFHAKLK